MKIKWKIISLLIGGIFLSAGVFCLCCPFILPEEKLYQVWLPYNAEIHPSEVVQPGTFKIEILSFEEFKAKTKDKDKVFVVYQTAGQRGLIEYWRPAGDGVFHYHLKEMPYADKNVFINWRISFSKQPKGIGWEGVFSYTPERKTNIILFFSLSLSFMGLGFLLLPFLWKKFKVK